MCVNGFQGSLSLPKLANGHCCSFHRPARGCSRTPEGGSKSLEIRTLESDFVHGSMMLASRYEAPWLATVSSWYQKHVQELQRLSFLDPVREAWHMLGAYLAVGSAIDQLDLRKATGAGVDVLDLFSGCGGMSAGFKAVAALTSIYNLAGALDIDQPSNRTYRANLSVQPWQKDIRDLLQDEDQLLEFVNQNRDPKAPLVLIGCAPCQGFSSHRKKDWEKEDERNSLVEVFAHLAARIEPDFIVMENVPELLAKRYWSHYERAKGILERKGYIVRARIVNMAEYGVPQERFRALVLASRRRFLMPKGLLPPERFRTVRDAIGGLEPLEPGIPSRSDPMHVTTRHRKSTIEIISKVPKDGGSRPKGVGPKCLDRVRGFYDVYGRLYWDRPAVTITAYCRNPASGRFVHPEQNRGLSIREAALLQGFPRTYTFEGPHDAKFAQIGNAVPPRFSAYLAAHLGGELFGAEPSQEAFADDQGEDVLSPVSNSFSSVIAGIKLRRRKAL